MKLQANGMRNLLIGVDTNIIVRYLTRDDEKQARLVDQLVIEARAEPKLFVNPLVLAEIDWVLRKAYKIGRAESQKACQLLLETNEFILPEKLQFDDLEQWFVYPDNDFSDVLISEINRSNGCSKTVTFDRKAARQINSMELLT